MARVCDAVMALVSLLAMISGRGHVDACNSSKLMSCLQLDLFDLFDRFRNHSFFPAYDNHTLDTICRSVRLSVPLCVHIYLSVCLYTSLHMPCILLIFLTVHCSLFLIEDEYGLIDPSIVEIKRQGKNSNSLI